MCDNSYAIYLNYQKVINPTYFSTVCKFDHSLVCAAIYTKAYTITTL